MHKKIYISRVTLILLSILVIGTSIIGCKKQQSTKENSTSKVEIVEGSYDVSNSTKVNANTEKTLEANAHEKKNEIKLVEKSEETINNKNKESEYSEKQSTKQDGSKSEDKVGQQQTVHPDVRQDQSSNSTSSSINSQPSTSSIKETTVQSNPIAVSQTGTQQNQGTATQTNQGQTNQPSGELNTQTNGGTSQTGGGSTTSKPNGGTTLVTGDKVVTYASNFLGTPYQWGGTTPKGFDNSGFVQYVFAHFGIEVGRRTYDQIKAGTSVSKDQLKPGDIVFFGTLENPVHVGIYTGNNCYVHVMKTGDVVKESELNRTDYVAARRVF